MEEIATFSLLFLVYFLGILALVQLSIRPVKKLVSGGSDGSKHWKTNYFKIILLSGVLALVTSFLAYYLFP